MASNVKAASPMTALQSITQIVQSAQDLADQAMSEADPAERAKIIEKLFGVLESEQRLEALPNSAA